MNNSFIAFGRHMWATKNRLTNYPGTGMDFRSRGFGGTIMPFDIIKPSTTHSPYFLKKKMTDDSATIEKDGHGFDGNSEGKETRADKILRPIEEQAKEKHDSVDAPKKSFIGEEDDLKDGGSFKETDGQGKIASSSHSDGEKETIERGDSDEEKEREKEKIKYETSSAANSLDNRNSIAEVEKSLMHPVKVDKVQLLALKRKGGDEKEEKDDISTPKYVKKKNHKFNIV